MKPVISVLLFILNLIGFSGMAQEIPRGYEKYEMEDLSFFRKKIVFQDPFANNTIQIDTQKVSKPRYGEDTSLVIITDYGDEISNLIERHKAMDHTGKERLVKGFRVQLYAGLDRAAADKVKVDFLGTWPETQVYQSYSRPTFKVRVGNFLTRSEAEMFCQRVKNYFSGAFVVPELIQLARKENLYEIPPPQPGDK